MKNRIIECNSLKEGFDLYQQEYEKKALEVLRSGRFIMGDELREFEKEFAAYNGIKYCIGVASGLDALWIAFRVLGIGKGDEVIVPANTYIASVMGITINGATPVFVEPNEYYNLDEAALESKITKKTKAILIVHLYGQAADMSMIMRIANKYKLKVVEDCAQAHGARNMDKCVGTYGDIGCFSFYPTKNLGCFGDGGAIITDDVTLAEDVRIFRNYGSEKKYYNKLVGANSRLDEIQAGLLRVKLQHLPELIAERKKIGSFYLNEIHQPRICLPKIRKNCEHVWHQFVIQTRRRDELAAYLLERGIRTQIHYPIPPHLSEAYEYLELPEGSFPVAEKYAKEILSLPIYNGMKQKDIERVVECVNEW